MVYSFGLHGVAVKTIRAFAREQSLQVISVGYGQGWVDANWGDVDPFEWVQLFRQAKYVVTGTFHGTLFCLRQQARFCVLSHPTIDAKVVIPLELTGLQDRHIVDPEFICGILKKPIDYERVEDRRRQYADQSLMLLKRSLS